MQRVKDLQIKIVAAYIGLNVADNNKANCLHRSHKHNDRTASLQVYPYSNSWYCFACGKGGSVIDLVMYMKNISFIKAIEELKTLL